MLCERVIFGDAAGGPSSPKAGNHLGKPYRHYDEAGRVNFVSYDFKGNQIEQTRRVIDPQHMIDAYQAADSSNNWEVDTYRVDWTTSSGQTLGDRASQLLKPRDYTVTKAYDGLDRARQIQYPKDKHGDRALAEPAYNKAGNLQSVTLDGNAYVERIAYNPRGQRILAALGNGAMVRYEYDDVTFRLERLRSEGYTKPDQATYSPEGPVHQDFTYTYDAAGNITELDSDSANVGVGGTDHLQRVFEYDPIYRLKKATGREYAGSKTEPWDDNAGNSNDPNQTRAYTELFEYDDVGNMTKLTHDYQGSSPGTWTRNFSHETASNQLDTMNDGGGTTRSYTYDAAGNLTAENTNRKHEWDWGGRMRSFRDQPPGSQATVFAHYTYDSGGQRTQKVVCKDNDDPVHTVYIGGIYEHHEKISSGSVTAENNFLHIMDDSRRVAIKRIGPHLNGSNPANIQFHLGDHLQSSSVVLDGSGNFFNREEYRPYGETSFGSYDKKRYRFTGQERDEESGLNYHGARYYAPWVAKWTAPDPKGMVDGPNVFVFSSNNPIRFIDPTGMEPDESDATSSTDTTDAPTSTSGNSNTENIDSFPLLPGTNIRAEVRAEHQNDVSRAKGNASDNIDKATQSGKVISKLAAFIQENITYYKKQRKAQKENYKEKNWAPENPWPQTAEIKELKSLLQKYENADISRKSLILANVIYNETGGTTSQKARRAIAYAWLNRTDGEVRRPTGAEIANFMTLSERWSSFDDAKNPASAKREFVENFVKSIEAANARLDADKPSKSDPTEGATHWVSPGNLDPYSKKKGNSDFYKRSVGSAKNKAFPTWARDPSSKAGKKLIESGAATESFSEFTVEGVPKETFLFYKGVN